MLPNPSDKYFQLLKQMRIAAPQSVKRFTISIIAHLRGLSIKIYFIFWHFSSCDNYF